VFLSWESAAPSSSCRGLPAQLPILCIACSQRYYAHISVIFGEGTVPLAVSVPYHNNNGATTTCLYAHDRFYPPKIGRSSSGYFGVPASLARFPQGQKYCLWTVLGVFFDDSMPCVSRCLTEKSTIQIMDRLNNKWSPHREHETAGCGVFQTVKAQTHTPADT